MFICQNTAITKVAKALFKPFSFNQLQGTFISLQSQRKKKTLLWCVYPSIYSKLIWAGFTP